MLTTSKRRYGQYIDPVAYIRKRYGLDVSHWVTFDPNVTPQYRIIRGAAHDSTLAFTLELIVNVLQPVAARTTYYKPDGPPDGCPRYTVGWLRLTGKHYDRVRLPCGDYPGVRERVTLPVRVVGVDPYPAPVGLIPPVSLLGEDAAGVVVTATGAFKPEVNPPPPPSPP